MTKLKIDDLEKLCNEVIETSLNWTGADEDAIPGLKRMRTLAGLYLKRIEQDKPNGKDFDRSKELHLLNYSR